MGMLKFKYIDIQLKSLIYNHSLTSSSYRRNIYRDNTYVGNFGVIDVTEIIRVKFFAECFHHLKVCQTWCSKRKI
jgi:hypothetical protein